MKRIILSVTESTALTKLQSEIPAMAADSEEKLLGGFLGISGGRGAASDANINAHENCACNTNCPCPQPTPTPTPTPTGTKTATVILPDNFSLLW